MNGVNKVILLGNITKDIELTYTPTGKAVASFSIATNSTWKDKEGNQQKNAEFHRLVAWQKTAENAATYLKKGSPVYIEGRLQTRSWDDKDGIKRYTTEIVVENLVFVGSKGNGNSGQDSSIPEPTDEFGGTGETVKGNDNDAAPMPSEDDLPF